MAQEKKKRIVLVEDEQTLANLIELHLTKEGFDVTVAKDGKKGLALITKEKPDLVLLDVILPGLGGFHILEKLKAEGILPGLPVIIVSASGQPVEIERALRLGVRDYLIKVNFNPDEVMEKVRHVLKKEGEARKKAKTGKQREAKKKAPAALPKSRKAGSNYKALLIEDDELLVNALGRKFTQNNYEVFRAIKVDQARKILKEEQSIDVILLDIVLPDENGLTFLRELKKTKEWSDIPVLIISNLGQRDEIQQGIEAGAADYLVKAETVPEEIFQKARALCAKGQQKKKRK